MRGRNNHKKRSGKKGLTLKKVEKQIRKIQKNDKPEAKYVDSIFATSPNYNGSITDLTASITQGTNENQRVGTQIMLKYFRLRVRAIGLNTSTNSSVQIRVLLVRGNAENGTIPTVATTLTTLGTANATITPYNWDNKSKQNVLYDKMVTVASGFSPSVSAGWQNDKMFMKNVKLNFKSTYGPGTTPASALNHGLYLILISDTTSANAPSIGCDSRLVYTDA